MLCIVGRAPFSLDLCFWCSQVFFLCSQREQYNFSGHCYAKFSEILHDYLAGTAVPKLQHASQRQHEQFVAEVHKQTCACR